MGGEDSREEGQPLFVWMICHPSTPRGLRFVHCDLGGAFVRDVGGGVERKKWVGGRATGGWSIEPLAPACLPAFPPPSPFLISQSTLSARRPANNILSRPTSCRAPQRRAEGGGEKERETDLKPVEWMPT